jgi:sugar O-acyltransferase (sialic acid O-acetyltransferase NeuD family)
VTSGRTPLLIMGAGGLGRELYGWIAGAGTDLQPIGFCDDTPGVELGRFGIDLPVGPPEEIIPRFPGAKFLIAIGAGTAREKLASRLINLGIEPATFVHPSVIMGPNVEIGEGSIVCPATVITTEVRIGRFVLVNCSCNIGHDVTIGDYSTLLGNNAVNGSVTLGSHVNMGSGSLIHPKLRVGDGATIGIGSVVIRNVATGTSVFGVPAVRLG